MLNRIVKLLPPSVLNDIHDAIFAELICRGEIKIPDSDHCIETPHRGYLIKLRSELDHSYTTTWAVYKGEHLICEGEDEFHSSVGEAEHSAIQWIDRFQYMESKCLPN